MTGNVLMIRHSYKVLKALKVYTIYQLVESKQVTQNGFIPTKPELTELIRIEQFRHFSKGSGFDNYLRLRNVDNWNKCEQVTGLFNTGNPFVFYGNRINEGKKHLLIFKYSIDFENLTIDYFKGYYPQPCDLSAILNRYISTSRK
jgi:hypothetical protein